MSVGWCGALPQLPSWGCQLRWRNLGWFCGKGGMLGRWHSPATLGCCLPEEAVNEVKRQAMSELQKAVSDAERKAHELITTERAKMERALAEAKRQASEDALTVINQQEDSSEVGTLGTRLGSSAGGWDPLLLLSRLLWCEDGNGSPRQHRGMGGEGNSCTEMGIWGVGSDGVHGEGCTVLEGVHGSGERRMTQDGGAQAGMERTVQDEVCGP